MMGLRLRPGEVVPTILPAKSIKQIVEIVYGNVRFQARALYVGLAVLPGVWVSVERERR